MLFKFIIKSCLYLFLLLCSLPAVVAALATYDALSTFSSATHFEGKVVGCSSYKVINSYNSDRYSVNHKIKVRIPSGKIFHGSFGFPTKNGCEQNIKKNVQVIETQEGK